MKSTNTLVRFWQIIDMNDKVKNRAIEPDDIRVMINETIYLPIDTQYCLIETPDCGSHILVQQNGVIVNSYEGGEL